MPRLAREYQLKRSYIFHSLNRGILRQAIFHDHEDFSYFLKTLRRYKEKLFFSIYHWCLMPNHYHLLGEFPPPVRLSKIIGACQQIYAAYYHRKYQTAGKLFQNRFKSQAIEKEVYLLSCGRYVELNPVRAKLVKYPWDWKWSSARFYVNGEVDGITSFDPEWEDKDKESYKRWLSDWETAEKEREIFFGSCSIIGRQEFKKMFTMEAGHAKPMLRGKCRIGG